MKQPSNFDREKFEDQIQSWLSPLPNNELGILLHLVHAERARRKKQNKRRQKFFEERENELHSPFRLDQHDSYRSN